MYQATLFFPNGEILSSCYLPEERNDDRVHVSVQPGNQCQITLIAKDSLSFRATLTTLVKLLSVFEKVSQIS